MIRSDTHYRTHSYTCGLHSISTRQQARAFEGEVTWALLRWIGGSQDMHVCNLSLPEASLTDERLSSTDFRLLTLITARAGGEGAINVAQRVLAEEVGLRGCEKIEWFARVSDGPSVTTRRRVVKRLAPA